MEREPTEAKDIPGVVAPPPLIYLGGLAAGFALQWAWPLAVPCGYVPAAGVAIAGIALMAWGIATFKREGTDYLPYRPSSRLIVSGPFRFTRNPLYLAMTLVYLGIAVGAGNLWLYLLLIPVLAVMRYGVVGREEAYLERKFGTAYTAYKAGVARWIGLPHRPRPHGRGIH